MNPITIFANFCDAVAPTLAFIFFVAIFYFAALYILYTYIIAPITQFLSHRKKGK